MMRFHDPRAEIAVELEPYTLGIDLGSRNEVTVGFLANGFPDSERFLDVVAAAMGDALPAMRAARWNKGNASITVQQPMLEEIGNACDALVAAYGH